MKSKEPDQSQELLRLESRFMRHSVLPAASERIPVAAACSRIFCTGTEAWQSNCPFATIAVAHNKGTLSCQSQKIGSFSLSLEYLSRQPQPLLFTTGERAGFLQKISDKGWICKTWEGELSLVALPGAAPEKFLFTVRDAEVAKQVNAAVGKRVALTYEQHKGLPTSCFGETEYFVIALKDMGP
jgi:hypothetical protein